MRSFKILSVAGLLLIGGSGFAYPTYGIEHASTKEIHQSLFESCSVKTKNEFALITQSSLLGKHEIQTHLRRSKEEELIKTKKAETEIGEFAKENCQSCIFYQIGGRERTGYFMVC